MFKPPIHFFCVLHAKWGGAVQKACKTADVINERPVWNNRKKIEWYIPEFYKT